MAAGRRGKLSDRSARHDASYRRAKQEQYASRAIYKLEELDRKFRLLGPGKRVLDLGCWPGSWLQYIAARVGEGGMVVGIDLNPVETTLPPWVETIVVDVEELDPAQISRAITAFDVVLSDMAPHTTGDKHSDQWRSEELFLRALEIARTVLRPGGHFAAKVFQGGRFPDLIQQVRGAFQTAKPFHTKATRSKSPEQYIVGRGFRGR